MNKIYIIVSHEYGEDYDYVKILGAFDNKAKAIENLKESVKVVKEQFHYNNNEDDIEDSKTETLYHIWENCSYCGHSIELVETDLNVLTQTHNLI
jgi:hypothetical protein